MARARIQNRAQSLNFLFLIDCRLIGIVKLNHRHVIHSLGLCTFTCWPVGIGSNAHAAPRLRGEMCEFVRFIFFFADGVSGTAFPLGPTSGSGIDSSSSSCPRILCLHDFVRADLFGRTVRCGGHALADLKHVTGRQFHRRIRFPDFLSSMKELCSSRTILRPERTILPADKIGFEIFLLRSR